MMKAIIMMMLMALLCVQTLSSQSHSRESLLALDGPYLGQQPPGLIPEIFGPGIASTKEWGDAGTFSRDMTRFYVLRWRISNDARETASVTFEQMDQGWREIEDAERNGMPFFSPDGKREAPTPFGKEINTGTWNAHPFIAPDESYILWDGDSQSQSDLFWVDAKIIETLRPKQTL